MLEEYEEYGLYANTPYLLNENIAIEDIEQNLLDHGLDYKIDRELSDKFSVVLVGDNKVIHSIRGTDFNEGKDVLADMAIAINNPFSKKLLNTLSTIHGVSILQGFQTPYISDFKDMAENSLTKYNIQFYQNQKHNLMTEREFLMFGDQNPSGVDDYSPQWSLAEWQEELDAIKTKISRLPILQREEAKSKVIDVFKALSAHVLSGLGLNYGFKNRLDPEKDKLKHVQNKYKDREINLTGHSLGSIANVLGRENKIKTITLNPAPQSSTELPHPDSKIYRTHNDLVSYFLYHDEGDREPVIHIDSGNDFSYFKPFKPHFLSNFLPSISLKSVLRLDNRDNQNTPAIIPQINPNFKIKKKKKRFIHNHQKNLFMFDF